MALIPSTRYPAQIDTGDAGYPQGKARNAGAFQDGTGTPLEKDWINDLLGFQQALLADAGIVATGSPDQVGASQYLDAMYAITRSRRLLALALCKPRPLNIGVASDTNGACAVISQGRGKPAVCATMASGGVALIGDGTAANGGVVASITGPVKAGARNPSTGRLVLVGTGGNRSCFSTDGGANWSAGGDLGGSGVDLIWSTTNTRFVATYSGHVRYSTDAVAWTDVVLAGAGGSTYRGIGRLPNGNLVLSTGTGGSLALKLSSNGGASWGATGSPPPSYSSGHAVTGAGIDKLYFAGVLGSGAIEVFSSTDGNVWSLVSTLTAPAGLSYASGTTMIKQCPDTGKLFMTVASGASFLVLASLDGGVTWTEPLDLQTTAAGCPRYESWDVAGGRMILTTQNSALFMTDGLGWS